MERIRRCLNCMELYEDHLESCPFCRYREEADWSDPMVLKPGSILQGRYIVGTMRSVGDTDLTYIGWDGLFDRKVLIQEFFPNRLAVRDQSGRVIPVMGCEEELRNCTAEFVRIRENLIRLWERPDIICVFSAFADNGTGYMTYQYADAQTLTDYLEEHGPLSVQLARAYLDQAVNAVLQVHRCGLIHGNISTDSFWMTSGDRRLVLKDFAEPCHRCGNPGQTDHQNAGTWTDVRGLTLLFAAMMGGVSRIDPGTAGAVFDREKKLLSDMERRTLRAGLTACRGSEISTAEAFSNGMLGERRTEELREAPRQAQVYREKGSGQNPRRNLLIAGIAAIVIVILAIAAVMFFRGGGEEPEQLPSAETTEMSLAAEESAGEESEAAEGSAETGEEAPKEESTGGLGDVLSETRTTEETEIAEFLKKQYPDNQISNNPPETEVAAEETTAARTTEAETKATRAAKAETEAPRTTQAETTAARTTAAQTTEAWTEAEQTTEAWTEAEQTAADQTVPAQITEVTTAEQTEAAQTTEAQTASVQAAPSGPTVPAAETPAEVVQMEGPPGTETEAETAATVGPEISE